ncbi:unnamed protein product [Rotaria sp. Silwood1]|nr:unnamed protein product [Rotaria sp. Silwood1]
MVSVNTIQSGTVFAWFMFMMIMRRIVMLVVAGIAGRGRSFSPGSRVPEDKILKRVARICYAVAYIMALQPWRSLIYGVGLACTLACSLDLVITMSRQPN